MDIERQKRLLVSGIEAGQKTRAVRNTIKNEKISKQDAYRKTAEILKPSIDIQKETKEAIDKQQNELTKQLQKKKSNRNCQGYQA